MDKYKREIPGYLYRCDKGHLFYSHDVYPVRCPTCTDIQQWQKQIEEHVRGLLADAWSMGMRYEQGEKKRCWSDQCNRDVNSLIGKSTLLEVTDD